MRRVLLGLLAALLPAGAALAEGRGTRPSALLPQYQSECGACHVAFAPGLLPVASWQHLLQTLPQHFGVDASLDAATQQDIGSWLAAHAGRGQRARDAPPQDRITRAAWFRRQHEELPAEVWRRAAVKSAANCGACHPRAEQGDFDEDAVHVPS